MAWSELRGAYWRARYRDAGGKVKTLPGKYLTRQQADDAGELFEIERRHIAAATHTPQNSTAARPPLAPVTLAAARVPYQASAASSAATTAPVSASAPAASGGGADAGGGVTLGEWVARWRVVHQVAPATRVKNDGILDHKILPAFADWPLGRIKRLAVKEWAIGLTNAHVPSSIRSFTTLLSTILNAAVDEGLLDHNPITGLRLPSRHIGKRPVKRVIPTIDQVLAAAERIAERHGYPAWAQVITATYTGMRWGELCGLDRVNCHLDVTAPGGAWIDIDPDVGSLHEVDGHMWLGPPKSEAAVRRIDLPDFLAAILQNVIDAHTHPQVFVSAEGEWQRRSNHARRIWRPALDGDDELGWEPIAPKATFHGLRHVHKTILDELDLPEVLKHERMGHRMRGIAAVYSHVTPTMRTHTRQRLQTHWNTHTNTA